MNKSTYKNIDEYIALFPIEIQTKLIKLRETIKKIAPSATEKISYQMPTFYLNGNFVHFAAFKDHIGFYPTPSGITKFEESLKKYQKSKGTIKFYHNQDIPYEIIEEIVKMRVKENLSLPKKKQASINNSK